MNKKCLAGFGLIGLAVAAVYAYKHCRKVKDTVDKTVETVKEKTTDAIDEAAIKTFDASIRFSEKHPNIASDAKSFFGKAKDFAVKTGKRVVKAVREALPMLYPIAVIGAFGLLIMGSLRRSTQAASTLTIKERDEPGYSRYWDEKYRENYDRVIEFANSLNLFDGEMYIIEDQKQYIGQGFFPEMDPEHPIVSHMIYNDGSYPPEDAA